MRTLFGVLATSITLGTAPLAAQEAFSVEYLCGKAGFRSKVKGQLVVADTQVSFADGSGRVIFVIPVEAVGDAFSNEGQVLLGFCTSKKEELVFLYTETGGNAEAIAFKPEKGMASRIVAQVHAMRRPTPAARPDSQPGAAPVPHSGVPSRAARS